MIDLPAFCHLETHRHTVGERPLIKEGKTTVENNDEKRAHLTDLKRELPSIRFAFRKFCHPRNGKTVAIGWGSMEK
jgi:hypothetical protein